MEGSVLSNYQKAKLEADNIDAKIIETLLSGKSFRVEAGAGSGKTYSLNKVIEWIQENKWQQYSRNKQNVICVTYTNVAVEVISTRLKDKSFIIPSTIHSFAWNAIKKYQSAMIQIITANASLLPKEGDMKFVEEVMYTLGHRYIENEKTLYLHHNDVIELFSSLLDNAKFRKIFTSCYPLILIDEYQDSFKNIIDKFVKYFISNKCGPQFGFFGDAWQTIYQMNKPCGLIEHENILEIKKTSNFRSSIKIVELLNKIRPSLPQISAAEDVGEVFVITCNDFTGNRQTEGLFRGDLPQEEISIRLNKLRNAISKKIAKEEESLKVLMITHRVLASQQGYAELLAILGDRLKDAEDQVLSFFMNIVEPIYKALSTNNMVLLFETLGVKRYPIASKNEKIKWNKLKNDLEESREKSAITVLKVVTECKLIPINPTVENLVDQYNKNLEMSYENGTLKSYLEVNYEQFLAAINFLRPDAEFSTEHGVKGEEYENVVFTIGRGWNNYQFDVYAPMINNTSSLRNVESFERNRNLFYVCCSRPRKRLFIFITIKVEDEFEVFLRSISSKENFMSFDSFVEKFNVEE